MPNGGGVQSSSNGRAAKPSQQLRSPIFDGLVAVGLIREHLVTLTGVMPDISRLQSCIAQASANATAQQSVAYSKKL